MALPSAYLGEFLPHEPRDSEVSSEFLNQLRDNMHTALPPAYEFHGSRSAHTPNSLASTGYVYVRHDAHRKPLQRPYDGPFKILETHEKYYVLNVNGRRDSVSIDRLKTAYGNQVDPQLPPCPSSSPTHSSVSVPSSRATAYSALSLRQAHPGALPLSVGLAITVSLTGGALVALNYSERT